MCCEFRRAILRVFHSVNPVRGQCEGETSFEILRFFARLCSRESHIYIYTPPLRMMFRVCPVKFLVLETPLLLSQFNESP